MTSGGNSRGQVPPSGRREKVSSFWGLPPLEHKSIYELLERSKTPGLKDVFIDTDTYNEIDDQFALVHALLADKLNSELKVIGIGAAPFHNQSRDTRDYAHGMELSYQEIQNILRILDCGWKGPVYKGSTLTIDQNRNQPISSETSNGLCELVNQSYSETKPLYVLALGALTNIASAILMDPSIRGKMIVCTLGGLAADLQNFGEFNYQQDPASAQIVFASGVPIVHFAGYSVTDMLKTTQWELAANVRDKGEIGKFLYDRFVQYVPYFPGKSKTIWDFAPGAWVINPQWFISEVVHAPILTDDNMWIQYTENHPMRSIKWIDRDPIFNHFFLLLSQFTA